MLLKKNFYFNQLRFNPCVNEKIKPNFSTIEKKSREALIAKFELKKPHAFKTQIKYPFELEIEKFTSNSQACKLYLFRFVSMNYRYR
jgi:hypothetical protein